MRPSLRKLTITAHVTFSVGWLGAVAAFLVLSIAGLTSQDAEVVRGAYLSMNLISRFVIIPMCFAALGTGLLQALGTPWGLFRYYWILLKFGLAIFATFALLVHQFGVMAEAEKRISGAAAETLFSADLGPLKTELVRAPSLAIVLLLVAASLGVYKPWGLTRYGRRKQQERRKVEQQPNNETPLGVKIFYAVIGVLVLVVVVLHLTGHVLGATVTDSEGPSHGKYSPSPGRRSVNNREICLTIGEHAWQSPNRDSRRMTFRAGGLPGIIEKLPSDGPAFRPAHPFRPDHQHLPIHVRRDGRMLSIVTFAGSSDGCRNLERNGFDGIEVNLASSLPSST